VFLLACEEVDTAAPAAVDGGVPPCRAPVITELPPHRAHARRYSLASEGERRRLCSSSLARRWTQPRQRLWTEEFLSAGRPSPPNCLPTALTRGGTPSQARQSEDARVPPRLRGGGHSRASGCGRRSSSLQGARHHRTPTPPRSHAVVLPRERGRTMTPVVLLACEEVDTAAPAAVDGGVPLCRAPVTTELPPHRADARRYSLASEGERRRPCSSSLARRWTQPRQRLWTEEFLSAGRPSPPNSLPTALTRGGTPSQVREINDTCYPHTTTVMLCEGRPPTSWPCAGLPMKGHGQEQNLLGTYRSLCGNDGPIPETSNLEP
jgi:hypothetical protein